MEWILIITIHLLGDPGSMKDLEVEIIDGFTSEKTCLEAADKIGSKIVSQSINHLVVQKMNIEEKNGKPVVFTDCQKVIK